MSSTALKRKNKTRFGKKRANSEKSEDNENIMKYTFNKPITFEKKNQLRKSLFDYEREKMIQRGFVLYMQRVFIFVKNFPVADSTDISPQPSIDISKQQSFHITQQALTEEDVEVEHLEDESPRDDYVYMSDITSPQKPDEQHLLYLLNCQNLQKTLKKRLEKMVKLCNRLSVSDDKLTGLFLYMGNYSLIVLEGIEDAIELFCKEFNKRFAEFWVNNKVFMVEDNISKNYFDSFVSRSVHPVHMNQMFPAKHADDELFMGQQHQIIRNKLKSLCAKFLNKDEEQEEEASMDHTELKIETQHMEDNCELLAKYVPEVERIEKVLQSKRFYRDVNEFSKSFSNVLMNLDDEDISWPLRNNYTPHGIYTTSNFDYNLTYPHINTTAEEKTKRISKFGVRMEDESIMEEAVEEAASEEYLPKTAALTLVPSTTQSAAAQPPQLAATPSAQLFGSISARVGTIASVTLLTVPSLTLTAAPSTRTLVIPEIPVGDVV